MGSVCGNRRIATCTRIGGTTAEPVDIGVVVSTVRTTAYRIRSKAGASIDHGTRHCTVRGMDGVATRRTAHTIFLETCRVVDDVIPVRISVHTWLLLFIAAPVRVCGGMASAAYSRVVTEAVRPILAHTCH